MGAFYYLEKVHHYMNTAIWVIVLHVITLFIPALMLAFGIQNLDNCPYKKLVPIWLIIGGGLLIIHHSIFFTFCGIAFFQKRRGTYDTKRILGGKCPIEHVLKLVMQVILVGWLIGASIIVFPGYRDVSYDPTQGGDKYCAEKPYEFLYVKTIIMWTFCGIYVIAAFTLIGYGLRRRKV